MPTESKTGSIPVEQPREFFRAPSARIEPGCKDGHDVGPVLFTDDVAFGADGSSLNRTLARGEPNVNCTNEGQVEQPSAIADDTNALFGRAGTVRFS